MSKPVRAKKSFGQHFLHREDIAERIANSLLHKDAYPLVLEVGPGQGMLTKYLIDLKEQDGEKKFDLFAVEADRDMIPILHDKFPELAPNIIQLDFLKLDFNAHFGNQSLAIIGNFPYNISSQILIKMVEFRNQVPELVGMFQKEVAQRVVAPPGSKTYGVISVICQAFYDGEYLFTVGKGAFNPPPKVESAVIRMTRKENQELGCDEKLFRKVVKQAFSQRRKMLRNTMKMYLKDDPILQDPFFTLRPERLSIADFVKLTNWVSAAYKN